MPMKPQMIATALAMTSACYQAVPKASDDAALIIDASNSADANRGVMDATPDAPPKTTCMTWGRFSAPVIISELSTVSTDWAPSVSKDGLRMTFSSDRAGMYDLYATQRTSTAQPWGAPTIIPGLGGPDESENDPSVSSDGLEMYYVKDGSNDLFRVTRPSSAAAFGTPQAIVLVPASTNIRGPELANDDLTLYFSAAPDKLYIMQRSSRNAAFATNAPISDPDPTGKPGYPTLSADELELFISSDHAGQRDIWTSRRTNRSLAFPPATRNAELSSVTEDWDPEISFDGTTIWLASNRNGNQDIFVATRACTMP
jgi:Tol biopolymer transport system component